MSSLPDPLLGHTAWPQPPDTQPPGPLAPFPPCCPGGITLQGKHPRSQPRVSLLPLHPPAAVPTLPRRRLHPSPSPPCQAPKLGAPPAPRKGPTPERARGCTNPPRAAPEAGLCLTWGVLEVMEGPWLMGQLATSPPARWCLEEELPYPPPPPRRLRSRSALCSALAFHLRALPKSR